MSKPIATILVAIYKAGRFIEAKIQDLERQTYFSKCNVVLLNCQNIDGEADIYKSFVENNDNVLEIRYDHYVFLYPTWNDGIRATDSHYILNSNVDDMLHPEYVEACTKWLDENEEFCCVSSNVLVTTKPCQLWPDWDYNSRMPKRVYPYSTAGPCPVWRRSLHRKYGYFGNYRVVGDARMWERWLAGGEKFGMINRDLALYYANSDSLERRRDNNGTPLRQLDVMESRAWPKENR